MTARTTRAKAGALPGGWPLALGLMLLAALWLGPMPERARFSFTSHMALHLGVTVVAGPLLALGLARLRAVPRRLGRPGVAVAVSLAELVVVWGWHAPALHEAAALVPAVFAIQQGSFLLVGIAVWLPGLARADGEGAAAGVIGALMAFAHMSMLGVLLVMSPSLIYPPDLCLGGFGMGPLADQRIGGLMMAAGGGLSYLAGGLYFAHRLASGRGG